MSFVEFLDLQELENIEKEKEVLLAKKLADDTVELKEIMNDLNNIVKDTDIQIVDIHDKIEESNLILEDTKTELIKAEQLKNNHSLLKITGISTIIGLCIGGPLGILGGSYLGLAIGGGLLGSFTGGSIAGGTAYGLYKNKKRGKIKTD